MISAPRLANVYTLASTMTVAALISWNVGLADLENPIHGVSIPWWTLAIGFAITESFVVHLQIRQHAQSFSLSEIPTVIALFFVSPQVLLAARLIGSTTALVMRRRQSPVKLAFNLAYFTIDTCLLLALFHLTLGNGDPTGPAGWTAAAVACTVAMVFGTLVVAAAIALTEARFPVTMIGGVAAIGIPVALANVALGLVAVTILPIDRRAVVLFAALSVALYGFYRNHTKLRSDHAGLTSLYDISRTVSDALERGGTVAILLSKAAELMQAERAELVLNGPSGATRTTWQAGDDRPVTTEADDADALEELTEDEGSVLLTGRRHRRVLSRLGHRDAIVSRLSSRDDGTAILLVADRLGSIATFTEHDRRMLDTLANHASVALRNSSLLERVRVEMAEREHQALHDALTGLPNRTLFGQRVQTTLEELGDGVGAAVMLVDLDRFKEVNDTLGHHHGDRLLVQIGRRIRTRVGPEVLVARLGGDEFAVLVSDCGEAEAMEVAECIHAALEEPFTVDEIPVAVGCSVGIALAPEDGDNAETLLQHADVAMYLAKNTGAAVERYRPAADHYSPERLAMVAELKRAIEDGEVLVEYQPILDLASDELVGVECLARWHHRDHGWISPETFVPIAEHTGLIDLLTEHVLTVATRQCRAWWDEGLRLRISINISSRTLLEQDFAARVEGALDTVDLPASALVLEVTESTIMADAGRTIASLNRLAALGVGLSIDDYGTGYSSLAYLKNLPVDELKVDRAFVSAMATDGRDRVIVENTIDLAHRLQLRVVAEGVEDDLTLAHLRRLGCDRAQGFYLGRPKTPGQLRAWLAERNERQHLADQLLAEAVDLRPVRSAG